MNLVKKYRKMFFVLSRARDKEKIVSLHEESNVFLGYIHYIPRRCSDWRESDENLFLSLLTWKFESFYFLYKHLKIKTDKVSKQKFSLLLKINVSFTCTDFWFFLTHHYTHLDHRKSPLHLFHPSQQVLVVLVG